MAYGKLSLMDGQVLNAEHLRHIEEGISTNDKAIEELKKNPTSTGVGISKIEQTTTSTQDGGVNVVTVTKTDGTTVNFQIKNGSKGSNGKDGEDGADGVGIRNIEKTATNGLVDT